MTPDSEPVQSATMDFKTKEEIVAEYLREGILSGCFPRGTRLKQADLAEQLNLSITLINLIRGRTGRAAAEHRRLLKAMKTGDKKAVVSSVREHIEAGWHELQTQLEPQVSRDAPKGPKSKGAGAD